MLNETTWNAWIAILVILVLGAILITSLQILKERIVRWLERKGRIEKDPVKAALKRLRIASILYSIAILSLVLFRLPVLTRTISPQEIQSGERAIGFQEDLQKMEEVVYWGLIILTLVFGAGYNVMKALTDKQAKETEQEAPGTPSNIALDRRPRS